MKTPELSLLKIYQLINTVSLKADNDYFFRRRVLSSKIIILIIFKLILSKNKQGYLSVINEFWDECKIKKIPLKSKKSISASSF